MGHVANNNIQTSIDLRKAHCHTSWQTKTTFLWPLSCLGKNLLCLTQMQIYRSTECEVKFNRFINTQETVHSPQQ